MILNENAGFIVFRLIDAIKENKDYLSEIDGKIGDGDHGINMNKGFSICEERLKGKSFSLSSGLETLSDVLQEDIGGSMGPLYGVLFMEMADAIENEIHKDTFKNMLEASISGLQDIGNAKKGDKTLLDTLIPCKEAFDEACRENKSFIEALDIAKKGAKEGWQSTENMVAKIGRASRLGERSRGVLDAGATSCYIIIKTLIDGLKEML